MKKALKISLTAMLCIGLMASVAFAGKYKPGTYEGSAIGYTKKKQPGKIMVKVTVDADAVKSIEITEYAQTMKGKYFEANSMAKEQIPAQIIEKQSLVVDHIAKATMSSDGIALAVGKALHKATVKYNDGTYTGSAIGYSKKKKPGKIDVSVTIAGGKISKIEFPTFDQTVKGKQGEPVLAAKDSVPAQIMETQGLDVDNVAKATLTTEGIKLAVARALEQAR